MNRVTHGLLQTKQETSLTEAESARLQIQSSFDVLQANATESQIQTVVESAMTSLGIRAGDPSRFDAVLLSDYSDKAWARQGLDVVSLDSIPTSLRKTLQETQERVWKFGTIDYVKGKRVPGLIVGVPLTVPEIGAYEMYLVFPLTTEQKFIDLVRGGVGVTGFALLIGLGILAMFVTARVTEPIRQVATVAAELAEGHLDRRLAVFGQDDLARLASSFNSMADSLESQITRLEKLSQLQQQFASDVSHELRTPLTSIRMASEMIYQARSNFDEETARCAELLQRQVERFLHLLNDLLEISRFDAGAGELEATTVDLVALTRSVVEEHTSIAQDHHTSIHYRPKQSLAFVQADSRRISRIVRNLIANAIEHSEGKPIEVELATNEDAVSIGVRDFGVGISQENLELIFSRFWRADPARARTLGGSGLGLAISAEDAALHGGTLLAWGRPDQGAHFVLTLPRRVQSQIASAPLLPQAPTV